MVNRHYAKLAFNSKQDKERVSFVVFRSNIYYLYLLIKLISGKLNMSAGKYSEPLYNKARMVVKINKSKDVESNSKEREKRELKKI